MKTALITGITGQDGSYLAELLLEKGYKVHGIIRRLSSPNTERINHILDKINLHEGDLTDLASLFNIITKTNPDEIYNLASMSHVKTSYEQPFTTAEITGLGALRLLEAIRMSGKKIKFYQASSSEMFGNAIESPQSEKTPFHPRSPYGIAKVFAHHASVNYRESYGMFCCNGILFNHESPRRGLEFVSRKITHGVAKIKLGLAKELVLGNLDAKRDWGYAKEYVESIWLMMQNNVPDDFVIGTGENHSVKEFVEEAFKCAGITDWEKYVKINSQFSRPAEVNELLANPEKAINTLKWKNKTSFKELVKLMVDADLKLISENVKK